MRIGVVYGQERAFPQALMARLSEMGNDAEPVVLHGVTAERERPYDAVVDRISHDVPFYRAALGKYARAGVRVLPEPRPALDRLAVSVIAAELGIETPRRVALPSREHPRDVGAASLSNLAFPIDWQAAFSHVGFPAVLRPLARREPEPAYRVGSPDELFAAYGGTGSEPYVLEQALTEEARYRCLVVGGEAQLLRDARAERGRLEPVADDLAPALASRMIVDARKLAGALAEPILACDFALVLGVPYLVDVPTARPVAEPELLGDAFPWFVDKVAALVAGDAATEAEAKSKKAAAPRRKTAKAIESLVGRERNPQDFAKGGEVGLRPKPTRRKKD